MVSVLRVDKQSLPPTPIPQPVPRSGATCVRTVPYGCHGCESKSLCALCGFEIKAEATEALWCTIICPPRNS